MLIFEGLRFLPYAIAGFVALASVTIFALAKSGRVRSLRMKIAVASVRIVTLALIASLVLKPSLVKEIRRTLPRFHLVLFDGSSSFTRGADDGSGFLRDSAETLLEAVARGGFFGEDDTILISAFAGERASIAAMKCSEIASMVAEEFADAIERGSRNLGQDETRAIESIAAVADGGLYLARDMIVFSDFADTKVLDNLEGVSRARVPADSESEIVFTTGGVRTPVEVLSANEEQIIGAGDAGEIIRDLALAMNVSNASDGTRPRMIFAAPRRSARRAGAPDLAVANASARELAIIRRPAIVEVALRKRGPGVSRCGVALDIESVARLDIELEFRADEVKIVRFPVTFETPGTFGMRVTLTPVGEDEDPANNVFETFIRASSTEVRIAIVNSRPSVAVRTLRQTFARIPDVTIQEVLPYFESAQLTEQRLRDFDPLAFDFVVVGSIEDSEAAWEFEAKLAGAIDTSGIGALFFPGADAESRVLKSGGRLENVLPVSFGSRTKLSSREITPLWNTAAGSTLAEGPGWILAETYDELPPLRGMIEGVNPLPGSIEAILAPSNSALLATRVCGQGRTAIWLADGEWRWKLAGGDAARRYDAMFTRVAMFLLKKELSGASSVSVTASSDRIEAGGIQRFSATITDKRGANVSDSEVTLVVQEDDGERLIPAFFDYESRAFTAEARFDDPGLYRVSARVDPRSEETPLLPAGFVVYAKSGEPSAGEVSHEVATGIANAFGATLTDLGGLEEVLEARKTPAEESITLEREPLIPDIVTVSIIFALFACEWILRKIRGID
ncbi:MAG: hypothetical protein NUW37_17475 [Planctomycetes bacterium]|nr:hypothetical protein [Planctomycetota bacterium]